MESFNSADHSDARLADIGHQQPYRSIRGYNRCHNRFAVRWLGRLPSRVTARRIQDWELTHHGAAVTEQNPYWLWKDFDAHKPDKRLRGNYLILRLSVAKWARCS